MAVSNFLLFVFMIFIHHVIKNTFALKNEGIIGSSQQTVRQVVFKHQAAVISMTNQSSDWELVGGASIVDNFFVLGSAHSFLDANGKFKKLTFYVVVATEDLTFNQGIRIMVDVVFTTDYNRTSGIGDIAVIKLKHSLQLEHNQRLSKLELPNLGTLNERHIFLVSGYGAIKVKTAMNSASGKEQRIMYDTDLLLRSGVIKIVNIKECKSVLTSPPIGQLCGLIVPTNQKIPTGLCKGDRGNPLVSGRTLIGITSKGPVNCDNRFNGITFTNVTYYADFVQFVVKEQLHRIREELYMHQNNPHVLEEPKGKNIYH